MSQWTMSHESVQKQFLFILHSATKMSLNFKTYITNKDITHFGYKTLSLLAVTGILDLLIDEVKTGYVAVYRQIHRLQDSIL